MPDEISKVSPLSTWREREQELTRINTLDMSLSDEEFLELGDIFALIFIFSQGKKKWNVIRRRKKVIDRIFSTT